MVPLQVLFAFGIALMLARAQARRRLLPHRLLPARPRAAGRGHARIRLPPQPRHRARSTRSSGSSGIPGPLWFNDPAWAKPSLVLLALWGIGNTMIIFLASSSTCPSTSTSRLSSTARAPLQRLRFVTLPLDQPRDPVRGRPWRDPGVCSTSRRRTSPPASRPARRRRRGPRATLELGYPEGSTLFYPSSSTTTASASSTWATPSAMAMLLLAVAFLVTLLIIRNSRRWVHYAGATR